jgi:general stress protein 26
MTDNDPRTELRQLVDKGGIAMLTTVGADGQLEARPMDLQDFDDANRMWFFTEFDAPKVAQLAADPHVLVTFSGKDYVSVHGKATVVQDPARQEELWDASVKAWMQCEPTDPKVALVVVQAEGGQYWTSPGAPAALIGIVAAGVTRKEPGIGETGKVSF